MLIFKQMMHDKQFFVKFIKYFEEVDHKNQSLFMDGQLAFKFRI